ncbi:lysosomal proton-coupled steroid conjugate and bile acid symporter SLC46A3-like isoform X2 [Argopecten irradians]|uniref:lysosomal proton-coupled steroid conjugate and bile acid symporter SLC46A3-like isoform X2 n=1 Tax=Argopecten irradians TaxID=31199 RepID=UPI003719DD4E
METSDFSENQKDSAEDLTCTNGRSVVASRESFEVYDELSLLLSAPMTTSVDGEPSRSENVTPFSRKVYILGPILFLMSFGYVANTLIFTQRVYDITKQIIFPGSGLHTSLDEPVCFRNQNSPNYIGEEDIQKITSMYNMYASLCYGIPGVLSNLVFLALSDIYGRKLFIFITVTGQFIATGLLAIGMYSDWNIYDLLAIQLLIGFTGGWITSFSLGLAAIADVTGAGRPRALAIVLIEIAVGLGSLVGSAVSGYLIHLLHYRMAMVVSTAVACAGVVSSLVLPETLRVEHMRKLSVLQAFKNIFIIYTGDTSSVGRRWKFWMCLTALFFTFLSNFGKLGIETLYQLNSPFCWSPVNVGWYTTLRTGLPLVIGMGLIKPFQACMDEHVIGILGTISYIAGYVLEALATNDLMMFIVAFISFMGALPVPILRAIMSHMTPPEQQGSLFAGVAAVETVCTVVGSVTGNAIYAATVDWFRGFTFLLFAGYTGITVYYLSSQG